MTKSDLNEKILHLNKIRKTKPFIDKDLQIQIPELENPGDLSFQRTKSVYTHYCKETERLSPELSANELEVTRAMEEARQAREAWKRIQAQIQAATDQTA